MNKYKLKFYAMLMAALMAPAALVGVASAQSTPPTRTYIVAFYGASSPQTLFTAEVKGVNLEGVQAELNRLGVTADKVMFVMQKR